MMPGMREIGRAESRKHGTGVIENGYQEKEVRKNSAQATRGFKWRQLRR